MGKGLGEKEMHVVGEVGENEKEKEKCGSIKRKEMRDMQNKKKRKEVNKNTHKKIRKRNRGVRLPLWRGLSVLTVGVHWSVPVLSRSSPESEETLEARMNRSLGLLTCPGSPDTPTSK